jgi:hypothetical protein
MIIPVGVTFFWPGTNATIPAGWSRVTSFDDKFPKGTAASTNPNTTGDASTHTHTSTAHTHTAQSHTHTVTLAAGSGGGTGNSNGGSTNARQTHTHSTFATGAISNFSTQSTAVTYAAMSNNPPYYTIIYITPTSDTSTIPSGLICLASTTIVGMNICDGTASTPNLVGKYLLGASAGADGGATGGSTSNTHSITHSHTTTHYHAISTSAAPALGGQGNPGSAAAGTHTHNVTVNTATPTLSDTISLNPSEVVEPAYTKLLALQAPSNLAIRSNIIGMWTGTLSTIPNGWLLLDGSKETIDMRSRHLKVTGTIGEIGNTGGSNTHTHAAQNHTHAVQAHSHTVPNATHVGARTYTGGGANDADSATIHTASTDSVNLVTDASSTSADSSNNEPPYRTVAFIKLIPPGAQFLLNFI